MKYTKDEINDQIAGFIKNHCPRIYHSKVGKKESYKYVDYDQAISSFMLRAIKEIRPGYHENIEGFMANLFRWVLCDEARREVRRYKQYQEYKKNIELDEVKRYHQAKQDEEEEKNKNFAVEVLTDLLHKNPQRFACYYLRIVYDLSYAEIAGHLNWPLGTVSRRIHDAKIDLANEIIKRTKE